MVDLSTNAEMLEGISRWKGEHGFDSVAQTQRNLCYRAVADPSAFERTNYIRVLSSLQNLEL